MRLKFRSGIGIFCLMTFLAVPMGFAQSITAPFDPTESTLFPAAAGWREDALAGFSYREASGNREVDGKEQYRFDSSGITANAHFRFSNISFDMAGEQNSTQTTVDRLEDGWINLDYDVARVNVALSGNDFVSIGLGSQTHRSRDFFDASHDSEETTRSSFMGGVSVKAMNWLYLGGGYERIKEESSYSVDNAWNEITLGVSAMFGEPGATRLRLEYSFTGSPRTESSAGGEKESAVHQKTDTSRYAAELMFSGLLFTFRGMERRIQFKEEELPAGSREEEMRTSSNEAGVLWIPESGVVLGFCFASSKTDFYFEDERTEFRVNVGYIFE